MASSSWGSGGMVTYSGKSPCTTSTGNSFVINWSTNTATAATGLPYKSGNAYSYGDLESAWYDGAACNVAMRRMLDKGKSYELPDGSNLVIDDLGNYRIEDKSAKVTYKANRIREFSPHLNASDMVAKFMEYVGALGVKQGDMFGLPIQLFIHWLIIEAAERDNDPLPDDVKPIANHPRLTYLLKPKCLCCGRFIPRLNMQNRFPFCSPEHGAMYVERRIQPKRIEQVEVLAP